MRNNTLIIISVPFGRNARYLLSSKIYERLKEVYDVLIVSPFADYENFRKEFDGPNVSFFAFDKDFSHLRLFFRMLYSLSEILRFNGYWFRFRKKMGYYWKLSTSCTINDSGAIIKKPLLNRLKIHLCGRIAYFRFVWNLIDKIFGHFFYDTRILFRYTKHYERVVIVQTANWGYQERFLAYFAYKFSYKSIFVPYSFDQLTIDGYLISDFSKICTQGPIETDYVIRYHNIPLQKICPLGMLWLRNLDSMLKTGIIQQNNIGVKERVIMYAGVSPQYFPREAEFEAIDRILAAMQNGTLPNSKLIYRPLNRNDFDLQIIKTKYQTENLIEIQIPQLSFYGITTYTSSTVRDEIVNYLNSISSINVFIMSLMTGMFIDALYLGKPVISNYIDPTLTIKRRGELFALYEDAIGIVSTGIDYLFSFDDLIPKIREGLDNPSSYAQVKENILSRWDYQNQNYVNDFMTLIKELSS